MPWDLHGVPEALIQFLRREFVKGTVLVPGCGSGYEVKAFQDAGWKPLAIDFSPVALERAREVLDAYAANLRLADFFSDDLGAPFDLVYERTFLCSLPTERWPDYAERMSGLIKQGGRLAGIFAYGDEAEPPPFLLSEDTAGKLFGSSFALAEDRAIPAEKSLPLFAGKERWQVWRRK
jgi:thiopurine S-methyltransferase